MKEFNQALTVFNKFEEIWNKLGIRDKTLNKVSADKIRKFAWLIFSISKGITLIKFKFFKYSSHFKEKRRFS